MNDKKMESLFTDRAQPDGVSCRLQQGKAKSRYRKPGNTDTGAANAGNGESGDQLLYHG